MGKDLLRGQAPKPIFLCTRGEDGLDTLMINGLLAKHRTSRRRRKTGKSSDERSAAHHQ